MGRRVDEVSEESKMVPYHITRDGDRVAVIDWDEAANGDPHFDWGSLLADLRGRGFETDWVEPLAAEVLGDRFDALRMAWQHAAHEARRVVEANRTALEAAKARLENILGSQSSYEEMQKASQQIGDVIKLLDEKEMRWLELSEKTA